MERIPANSLITPATEEWRLEPIDVLNFSPGLRFSDGREEWINRESWFLGHFASKGVGVALSRILKRTQLKGEDRTEFRTLAMNVFYQAQWILANSN